MSPAVLRLTAKSRVQENVAASPALVDMCFVAALYSAEADPVLSAEEIHASGDRAADFRASETETTGANRGAQSLARQDG